MPSTPGLSLLGFMTRDQAIHHLRTSCVPAIDTDAALEAEWNTARAKVTTPINGVGLPALNPLPASHAAYITALTLQPWYQQALFAGHLPPHTFQMVEVSKLLAYQFDVDIPRSQFLCAGLSTPPTLDELLQLCLPINLPVETWDRVPSGPQSMMFRSKGLNLRIMQAGHFKQPHSTFAGMIFSLGLPLVHVVRLNGRCYLHNGFHRACGAIKTGAAEIPCIFRDVSTPLEAGINAPATFDISLLESANPPSLAHFAQGMAHDVQIRAVTKYLHVSWAECIMPDNP